MLKVETYFFKKYKRRCWKLESKCQKCFYYRLCVQHDYVVEDEQEITNNYCGIYENGIPSKYWNGKEECEEYAK